MSSTSIALIKEPEGDDVVDPWNVTAGTNRGIDYDRLIHHFGCEPITQDIIDLIQSATKQPVHHLLRRKIFFSHRSLRWILEMYMSRQQFFVYSGRGPSSEALHLGHLLPFQFCVYLQKVFNAFVVIQLTDDEKFFFKPKLKLEETQRLARLNAKDIIACGFNIKKTFIFNNTQYMGYLYPNVCRLQKAFTMNAVKNTFGFDLESREMNVGKIAFPAIQAAPAFSSSFTPHIFPPPSEEKHKGENNDIIPKGHKSIQAIPCLIPQGIDQDPYFRLARQAAEKLGFLKPALIHSKFFPALQGGQTKMNSSDPNSAIFVTDATEDIARKIKKFAFSGGGSTKEIHEKQGADLSVDVSYQYLLCFMEDDKKLEWIGKEYAAGRIQSSEVKQQATQVLQSVILEHKKQKELVTEEVVDEFMRVRQLV